MVSARSWPPGCAGPAAGLERTVPVRRADRDGTAGPADHRVGRSDAGLAVARCPVGDSSRVHGPHPRRPGRSVPGRTPARAAVAGRAGRAPASRRCASGAGRPARRRPRSAPTAGVVTQPGPGHDVRRRRPDLAGHSPGSGTSSGTPRRSPTGPPTSPSGHSLDPVHQPAPGPGRRLAAGVVAEPAAGLAAQVAGRHQVLQQRRRGEARARGTPGTGSAGWPATRPARPRPAARTAPSGSRSRRPWPRRCRPRWRSARRASARRRSGTGRAAR